jgi:hypothetical protein
MFGTLPLSPPPRMRQLTATFVDSPVLLSKPIIIIKRYEIRGQNGPLPLGLEELLSAKFFNVSKKYAPLSS